MLEDSKLCNITGSSCLMAGCLISEMLPSIFNGIILRYVFRFFLGDQ